eukprot:GSChrysophyteH1.ASY1.ANO1.2621.1 assembled CDS
MNALDEDGETLPLCMADPWDEERRIRAEKIIREQGSDLSSFWREKYKADASKYWHQFYKRNNDNFYKDRHYLHLEFPELLLHADQAVSEDNTVQLLEVGCGVGNAVLPLLDLNPNLRITAIDFAKSAIEILSNHDAVLGECSRLHAAVCDVINEPIPLPASIAGQVDMILCLFVISAISPEHQKQVFAKLAHQLRPGGKLLFRDYGRYDEAQLRFKKGSKVQSNLYVRNDGTLAYYFVLDELEAICHSVGLTPVGGRCGYIRVAQANRLQGQARHRVFLQGVFEKAI